MSAADSLATSETIADPIDDEALESVDDEVAIDAVEALDDELDDSSAVSRLVRSASSVDSRLAALDELSDEVDELESLALDTPGGGPGGGPPTPPGPPEPPLEALLSALWLLSDETPPSCDRKASTAADRPIAVEASEDEDALLADVEIDALAVDVSEELLWLAKLAWSSRNNCVCELKPEMDIDIGLPPNVDATIVPIGLRKGKHRRHPKAADSMALRKVAPCHAAGAPGTRCACSPRWAISSDSAASHQMRKPASRARSQKT